MPSFLPATNNVVAAIALLFLTIHHLFAQTSAGTATVKVTGIVTDDAKQPLEGVSRFTVDSVIITATC